MTDRLKKYVKGSIFKNGAYRLLGFISALVHALNCGRKEIKDLSTAFFWYGYNCWWTYLPIHYLRKSYLRMILSVELGKNTFVHMACRFEGNIRIGNNSVIGRKCVLMGDIMVGDNVSITAETYIFTSSHFVNDPFFTAFNKAVVIENKVWVGARAMILPGVKINEGAVVAACAVVTKDIPAYSVYGGIPAKPIGIRSRDLRYELNYFPYFQ